MHAVTRLYTSCSKDSSASAPLAGKKMASLPPGLSRPADSDRSAEVMSDGMACCHVAPMPSRRTGARMPPAGAPHAISGPAPPAASEGCPPAVWGPPLSAEEQPCPTAASVSGRGAPAASAPCPPAVSGPCPAPVSAPCPPAISGRSSHCAGAITSSQQSKGGGRAKAAKSSAARENMEALRSTPKVLGGEGRCG
eukprot:scaffold15348_cov107-Isochrysis_galbana.AAC.2